MFRVVETLYGLGSAADEAPRWMRTCLLLSSQCHGALVGQFYLDLYARPSKRGGA